MDDRWGSVILSGGRGRRMGGVDKSGLTYRGMTYLERIREQLQGLGTECFLSRAYDPDGQVGTDGPEVIGDTVRGPQGQRIGPMGGIWSCFQETGLDGLFFVSCDMPLFRREMAGILMERRRPGVDVVLWRTRDKRLQPMCGFYSRTCLDILGTCIEAGNYRMTELLSRVRCQVVDTSEVHIPDTWFMNVNTPECCRRLEHLATPVLAVSGRKDTGKTTLLAMLVEHLRRAGIRSAVIKHDGHEFQADTPGTDSRRLKEAGAMGTVVYSANKYSLTKDQPHMSAEDFFSFFPEADLILLEGQKRSGYPKLEVLRREVSIHPVCCPGTVLAYVWSTKNGWEDGQGNQRAVPSCPVLLSSQKDDILETVVGFMDRCNL